MKKDKILLKIDNMDDLSFYEKLGISNFLFPLKDFSIGYPTFTFEEITSCRGNIYIFMNRLLTDSDIDEFLKESIPSNVRGFILEDVGLYEILKSRGYEVINFQNHLNNNYKTVNYWLKYCDSLVVSTDLSEEEIDVILDRAVKPLVLNTFGYPMIMYSRRTLISNYYRYLGRSSKNELDIVEKISGSSFFLEESEWGTAVFNSIPFYNRKYFEKYGEKIRFYLIDTFKSERMTIERVLEGQELDVKTRDFLDQKTVYRIGDLK